MTTPLTAALKALTKAVNLSTGLLHPNDMNRAKETFTILHQHGEVLLKQEIEGWAVLNGWKAADAEQLGSLAQQIGEGKNARITGGPWWGGDIYERWVDEVQ